MGSLRVETGVRGTGLLVSLSVARTVLRTFIHAGFMLRSDRILPASNLKLIHILK